MTAVVAALLLLLPMLATGSLVRDLGGSLGANGCLEKVGGWRGPQGALFILSYTASCSFTQHCSERGRGKDVHYGIVALWI